jgi:hypothetical protein
MFGLISPHPHIEAWRLVLEKLEERLHCRVRSQGLDRVEVFGKVSLAEERMNHAVTDFVQAHDGECTGMEFVAFFPAVLLGVEVMARDFAVERATAEGAQDRLRVGHMILPPFILIGRVACVHSALPHELGPYDGSFHTPADQDPHTPFPT